MRGERGFALVITLVISALLVALVVQFIDDVFVETSSRQNFVDGQQAGLMANSGVEAAISILQFTTGRSYTTLADQWAKPLEISDEKGALKVVIEDETSKLNLNLISGPSGGKNDIYYDIAARLLKKEGLSLELLEALRDWMDTDDVPFPGGAESSYYMSLKQPYRPHNSKLRTFEELALVKGFTRPVIERLRPLVTVYPNEENAIAAPININTAPRKIIGALSDRMSDELANTVIDYRITNPLDPESELFNIPGVETSLGLPIKPKGMIYRIVSEASVREVTRTVEAVIDMDGQRRLYWREY